MTTPFLSYAFLASGANVTTSFTLPDRLAFDINVKDYGAIGNWNGSTGHDDTTAIQNALDAAFGPSGSQHGDANKYLNKRVIFPPGNYKITSTVHIYNAVGARIMGAGSKTTTITYAGTIPGGATRTVLFHANRPHFGIYEGISFVMVGSNTLAGILADNTVCFDYNDDGTGDTNGDNNTWINCSFSGATWGVALGQLGLQCDEATWVNCTFDNCYIGLQTSNPNAICNGVYGGKFSNCFTGILLSNGQCGTVSGVTFENNGGGSTSSVAVDIQVTENKTICVIGCHSTSPQFMFCVDSAHIVGCTHDYHLSSVWILVGQPASVVIEDCHTTHGYISGGGPVGTYSHLFMRNVQFDNPDWSHVVAGVICEYIGAPPFTFSTLPAASEGLLMNITDSTTATWGATVAGSGGNKAYVRWNGSNWTVVGI